MTYVWQDNSRSRSPATAAFLPPPAVQETAWDILLTLYSHRRGGMSRNKLACQVSAPRPVLARWLALLEQQRLVTGASDIFTGEPLPVLTSAGGQLLDRYLSATSDLQVRACN